LGFVPHNKLFFFKESKYLDVSIENFKTILENPYITDTISCLHLGHEKIAKLLKVTSTVTEIEFKPTTFSIYLILNTSNNGISTITKLHVKVSVLKVFIII
jgi:hypothetical protein